MGKPARFNTDLDLAKSRIGKYLSKSKATNTIKAYTSDWKHFSDWCAGQGLRPLPADPDTVVLYMAAHAEEYRTSTIKRKLSSIGRAHDIARLPSPVKDGLLQTVWDGIRRQKGTLTRGKTPLLAPDIIQMVSALPDDTLAGLRDRALLLVGFAGCFRRSELVDVDVDDLEKHTQGLVILLRRSKTDQEGEGLKKAIPYAVHTEHCPVTALERWLTAARIRSGPVFRRVSKADNVLDYRLTSQSVALIVKKAATLAGLDPKKYAGHSLRSGLATQAAINGATETSIIRQGGWRSEKMARRYIRDGDLFRDNAAGSSGL